MAGIDDILSGEFFNAFFSPLATAGFPEAMVYLFFLAIALVLIYMKTKNLGGTSLALILVSGAIIPNVEPTVVIYFQGLLFFGVVSLIYALYKGD